MNRLKNGYIGVTSREWFMYLKRNNIIKCANFWRKNTRQFRSLNPGDPFFFLVKNKKGIKKERKVLGYGLFSSYEVLTVDEAWKKYKQANGDKTQEDFQKRMIKMYSYKEDNPKIGCIILNNIVFFESEINLRDLRIQFKNSIVSGKKISFNEVEKILRYEEKKEEDYKNINNTEDIGFKEGEPRIKYHIERERNPQVIKLAKEKFKQKHGKVFCEICGFDFQSVYGELGRDYIEGHHSIPVSDIPEGYETKIEDIVLVCANCHRMLHRKKECLNKHNLKMLLKK